MHVHDKMEFSGLKVTIPTTGFILTSQTTSTNGVWLYQPEGMAVKKSRGWLS